MIYKIYRNKLINASQMINNGCITLSLFEYARVGQTGRDDHESELVGCLTLNENWNVNISQLGLPVLEHSDGTVVVIEGQFAEAINQLPHRYKGIQYSINVPESAIDLADSDHWQELTRTFLTNEEPA